MIKHINIYIILSALALIGLSTVLYDNNTAQGSDESNIIISALSARPTAKGIFPTYQTFSTDWSLFQCDEKPSVNVNGYKGYRIVLKSPVKLPDMSNMPQQRSSIQMERTYITYGYVYVDLVLIPVSEIKHKIDKSRIPWLDLQQYCYAQTVDMGEGRGYHWFAKAPIMFQDPTRIRLGLTGGDDRLQMLTDSLTINDTHNYTASYASVALQSAGEKAFPYIKRAIREHPSDNLERQIYVLSKIPGNDATKLLVSLCKSDNKNIADRALYTLISPPYKKAAKLQYMELLQRGKYVSQISNICVQFEWKDAVPKLKQAFTRTEDWREYRTLFENTRKLENKPTSESLKDAEITIQLLGSMANEKKPSGEQIEQAKKAILNADDKEYAAVVAASLALYRNKANLQPVQDVGMQLLEAMPRTQIKPLAKIIDSLYDHYFKANDINRIYELLTRDS